MECVGISCFDPAGEPEDELVAAAPEEVLLGACEKNWRTAAPTREKLWEGGRGVSQCRNRPVVHAPPRSFERRFYFHTGPSHAPGDLRGLEGAWQWF